MISNEVLHKARDLPASGEVWRVISGFDNYIAQHELANKFGISQPLISMVIRRKIWTHIK